MMVFRFRKPYARLIRNLQKRTGKAQVRILENALDICAKELSNGKKTVLVRVKTAIAK